MAENEKEPKRYYWLKLQSTYFNQLEQKKMRKQENGKDMQIVYLRMMLLSIDKGGYIYFQGVYDTLEEELAEEFGESLEIVKKTLDYLKQNSMISVDKNFDCFIPEALVYTGSECYSAERVRNFRKRQKELQCNIDVTDSNTSVMSGNEEKELEKKKELHSEVEVVSSEPDKSAPNPSGILLPLNDNSYYDVSLDKISTWKQAYPAVAIEQELQKMRAWLESNPTRRKTKKGIDRFINTWLSKEQDKGGVYRHGGYQNNNSQQDAEEEKRLRSWENLIDCTPRPDDPFQ